MPKASLFFFPAGIRLVAFLAARSAGLLGVSLGTITAASLDTSWHPSQLHDYISIVVFFCVLPYLGALAAQRFLRIDQQFSVIKVWQIAAIAALVSLINGASINIYMVIENVITLSDFDTGVLAAAVGDMTGIAFVLFMVSFFPNIYRTGKKWFE